MSKLEHIILYIKKTIRLVFFFLYKLYKVQKMLFYVNILETMNKIKNVLSSSLRLCFSLFEIYYSMHLFFRIFSYNFYKFSFN